MRVAFPSVRVDRASEDFLDASQATCESANSEFYNIPDGESLDIKIDGGTAQVIVFNDVDFADISKASLAEVLSIVVATLVGGTVENRNGHIFIRSVTFGAGSSVEVTGEPLIGGATPSFDFPAGIRVGTDATTGVTFLTNRQPEPGEINVPLNAGIQFDLHNPTGAAPLLTGIDVYIDGVLAYDGDGGGVQAGFFGTASTPDFNTARFDLGHVADFDSEVPVDIRVIAPAATIDELYTFSTADVTEPDFVGVQARDKRIVRVTYNDDIQQVSPAASNDALNPANYIFVHTTKPAVDVVVKSVAVVDSRTVDLTTDIEMTFGAGYALSIVDVEDTSGNIFVPAPDNTLNLVAFTPPFPAGRRFKLIEFIPLMNRYEDATGELHLFIAVFQEVTNLLLCEIDRWGSILDLDLAPDNVLNAMLADLGNPFDRFALSTNDKRRLLRVLVDLYKQKGSKVGIINAVRFFLGIEVEVNAFNGEGWELAANPSQVVDVTTVILLPLATVTINDVLGTSDALTVESTAVSSAAESNPNLVPDSTATTSVPPEATINDGVGTSEQLFVSSSAFATSVTVTSDVPAVSGPGDELNTAAQDGTPPAILGPDQSGIYSFEVVSPVDLTFEQAEDIIFLANYMKPAHTHLVQILQPNDPLFLTTGLAVPLFGDMGLVIDNLELGFGELGAGSGNPGTWVLH